MDLYLRTGPDLCSYGRHQFGIGYGLRYNSAPGEFVFRWHLSIRYSFRPLTINISITKPNIWWYWPKHNGRPKRPRLPTPSVLLSRLRRGTL